MTRTLLDVFVNDPGPPEERAAFQRWIGVTTMAKRIDVGALLDEVKGHRRLRQMVRDEARAALRAESGEVQVMIDALRKIAELCDAPHVSADGVCVACEAMPDDDRGRADFCAYHRTHQTEPSP